MNKTINVGDSFRVDFEYIKVKGVTVPRGSILTISEIYPGGVDLLRCLVKNFDSPDFYIDISAFTLLRACIPFEDCWHKDYIEEPTSNITPKCDCGAAKVYGENIGPEMHAHYCSLKSQQLNT